MARICSFFQCLPGDLLARIASEYLWPNELYALLLSSKIIQKILYAHEQTWVHAVFRTPHRRLANIRQGPATDHPLARFQVSLSTARTKYGFHWSFDFKLSDAQFNCMCKTIERSNISDPTAVPNQKRVIPFVLTRPSQSSCVASQQSRAFPWIVGILQFDVYSSI
jgi:hypothetical protein